jgi:hypothetical protein
MASKLSPSRQSPRREGTSRPPTHHSLKPLGDIMKRGTETRASNATIRRIHPFGDSASLWSWDSGSREEFPPGKSSRGSAFVLRGASSSRRPYQGLCYFLVERYYEAAGVLDRLPFTSVVYAGRNSRSGRLAVKVLRVARPPIAAAPAPFSGRTACCPSHASASSSHGVSVGVGRSLEPAASRTMCSAPASSPAPVRAAF